MAIQRTLPSSANADSSALATFPSRTGRYLEAYTVPLGSGKLQAYADEGSYFVAYNVTHGTGIAGHAAPVAADLSTKPLLHIFNGSTTKSITLDFVRLRATAIGAGATTTDFEAWIDQAAATCKTSGGTVATSVNCRSDNPNTTGAVVSFGPVVATAHASERMIDHQRVRSTVSVVEDQYQFAFGNAGYGPATGGITMAGTGVIAAFVHFPPVVILPGGNFKLVQWAASQSGAHSFEYTAGWVER
jgi:hypothetical protein